jgi:hypothetical protein
VNGPCRQSFFAWVQALRIDLRYHLSNWSIAYWIAWLCHFLCSRDTSLSVRRPDVICLEGLC